MNSVIVSVNDLEDPPWLPEFRQLCEHVLALYEKHNWEVSVVLCTDGVIHALNREYRGKDMPTDVLSFCQYEGEAVPGQDEHGMIPVGDIVLSLDTIQQNARQCAISMKEELVRVFIHGLLHLGGLTHASSSPDEPMLALQEELLRQAALDTVFFKER